MNQVIVLPCPPVLISILLILAIAAAPAASAQLRETNSRVVELSCGTEAAGNATVFLPSLIANMDGTREQVRTTGFGISTNGSDHSLAQCYRGLSDLDCMLCYSTARTTLPQCFPYIGGRVYLDGCFMRAEKYDFYQELLGPRDGARCGNATLKGPAFETATRRAVAEAAAAASGGAGNATVVESAAAAAAEDSAVYVLADCWRSLNASACGKCLRNASASVAQCLPWSEGRALNTGCILRYSDTNFLNREGGSGISGAGSSKAAIYVVIAPALLAVTLAAGLLVRELKKKRIKRRDSEEAKSIASLLYRTCVNFNYSTLERATGFFDPSNKLGQGGYGAVYKGILADGREIAVKRLLLPNRHSASDLYNEAKIISSLEHKNLVRLLGCSCSGPDNLLVYEFLPNSSLDKLLFDPKRAIELGWEKRFGIIVGVARGLVYLHENPGLRIIHRDIKASNILLDSRLRPKIADFGLARSFHHDKTHITTALAGTIGYLAPEYIAHGMLTEKADVYSFGVLLLEIITGKPNNRRNAVDSSSSYFSLLFSVWKNFQAGRTEELIDRNILPAGVPVVEENQSRSNVRQAALRVVHVALLCSQENPSLRPSASRALHMLLGKELQLPKPAKPPFVDDNAVVDSSHVKHETGSSSSGAVVTFSSFLPR